MESMRMPQGRFVVADWFGPDPGHTDGERWNG
jgi:hypothetical protein